MRRHVRAPHATADLVQLGEAEHVRTLDDERVRLRDVEARLDDRRRHENVGVAPQKLHHPLLELALGHLAVGNEQPQVGTELGELGGGLLDRLDAVVEIERLAAALGLPLERMLDELLVVLPDVRPDRTAPLGRSLDHRDVAEAGERHVQRAGNRRRAQRQHVHLQAQLPQQFLLRDAEALFLVDDDEAEIRRDDVAREDAMRTDEDVHLARREIGERALHVGAGCGTATPSRTRSGSRCSALGTCSSAAARGSWWAPARASASR